MSEAVLNFISLVVIAACVMMVAVKGSHDENERHCTRPVRHRKAEVQH